MRLRTRLALFFAVFASVTTAVAFALTHAVFTSEQQRGLDAELSARAQIEADEVVRLGGAKLDIEQAPSGATTALAQLVKYGALFGADGELVTHTITFGDSPPTLASIGYTPGTSPPLFGGVDLQFGSQMLRVVVVAVASSPPGYLLLAASRDDLDSDAAYLRRLMALVFAGSVAVAVLFALLFGNHVAAGIDAIAHVARRVAKGELEARVAGVARLSDAETRRLASDLNHMIDRLEALISAERRFISHAAHELRSPLATLKGELELAIRHPRDATGYQAAIRAALEQTLRLETLAEDLLTLARFGMSAQPSERREAVADIVADALRSARPVTGCRIETHVDDALFARGQRGPLARLLRNLIDNAVAHAPSGSTVRIAARRDHAAGVVHISVEDDGVGVREEDLDRIFQPFFRGDRERELSGAGLGLTIAREIARVHGGELSVDHCRKPTRFVVILPVATR